MELACSREGLRIARVGKGSYYLDRPPWADGPAAPPRRSPRLAGPMPTNRFWSSAAWEPFSRPIYAHPLVVKAGPQGLGVGYPRSEVLSEGKDGRGSAAFHAYYREELVLGLEGQVFDEALVSGYSDWTVDLSFAAQGAEFLLDVRVGHGFPWVYAEVHAGRLACTFAEAPAVWRSEAHRIALTAAGSSYALFAPPGSVWTRDGDRRFVCELPAGKRLVCLALLPEASEEAFLLFARHAGAVPLDTEARFAYDPRSGRVTTEFVIDAADENAGSLLTSASAARGAPAPLVALYPHQWDTLDFEASELVPTPYTFSSPRGPMRLVAGRRIVTAHRYTGILPFLPLGDVVDREELGRLLREALAAPLWPLGIGSDRYDTYLVGKSLNRIAQLVAIADQLGDAGARERLLAALKARLERWLTVPELRAQAPAESAAGAGAGSGSGRSGGNGGNGGSRSGAGDEFFWYDAEWGALIGHPTSHGAGSDLNDHHFHYGYFIHAAGIVALYDPAWAAEEAWGGMIKLLARDFACPDRGDGRFPRLRCFDPFAGHSWASGTALYAEGNNQESSSEAIHAWAGLILFGEATKDRALRDLGIWGYTLESHAAWHYWFDVTGSAFPPGYPHKAISRLFGSGGDRDTWWTRHPIEAHGINALPLTGASLYLGAYPDRARAILAGLWAETGGRIAHWADIIYGFLALVDPDEAWKAWPLPGPTEFGETRAHTYHWLAALKSLGRVDPDTSADAPLAAVFQKGSERTYVAFHAGCSPRLITFSDGASFEAAPGRLVTHRLRVE